MSTEKVHVFSVRNSYPQFQTTQTGLKWERESSGRRFRENGVRHDRGLPANPQQQLSLCQLDDHVDLLDGGGVPPRGRGIHPHGHRPLRRLRQHLLHHCNEVSERHFSLGAFIYDVNNFFGFFDPPLFCPQNLYCLSSNLVHFYLRQSHAGQWMIIGSLLLARLSE